LRGKRLRDLAALEFGLPTHSKNDYHFANLAGIQGTPVRKLSPMRKLTHAMLFIALVSIFDGASLSAIAQQPANRQPAAAAPAGGAAPSAISTQGELKATVFLFWDGNLIAQYKYYWWHDGCYLSYEPTNFAAVPPAARS
jgi:hypothetical protein